MISVIGLDGSPLPAAAAHRLGRAHLVVGGARHLASVAVPTSARTVALGDLAEALDAIETHLRGPAAGGVVVLASGDPGFFGIVAALRRRGVAVEVFPAVSSVAAAFARAGMAWDDAAVVSAHGREPRTAYNVCRALPKVAVLTGPDAGPARLGAALDGWDRTLVVAERLGEADERVTRCGPAEAARRTWAEPNVVLVLNEPLAQRRAEHRAEHREGREHPAVHNQVAAPPAGWAGHEERDFRHRDSMITKWEVRAAALSRLRPTLGTLVWDVGAGSGSVAVDCARMRAAVVAVDPDGRARELVRANAAGHGVDVRVVDGHAPEAYAALPDPDAVFVGGGGLPALRGALVRRPAAVVATYAAVDRVAPAWTLLREAGYRVEGGQLAASRLADLPDGGVRLAAANPVFLIAGEAR